VPTTLPLPAHTRYREPVSIHRSTNQTISQHYQRVLEHLLDQPRTWLVTGAAGFIGSNLVEQLLELRQTVIGLDNFSTGTQANIDDVLAAHTGEAQLFKMFRGDIRDLDTCREACKGVDIVLHQAALGSVPRSIEDPVTTNDVNVSGFLNMLIAAHEAGASRFVYASSSSVYGDSTILPQVEERVGSPLSPYAVSKATDEHYANVFQHVFGLEVIGLRYFNVFGRRQDPAGAYAAVIPRWIASLLHGAPCRIFGDGQTSRDFCYVANAVQANLLAATVESSATNEVYNVACGDSTTLNELYRMIRLGLAGFTRAILADPVYEAFRPGDIRESRASIEKARDRLGYEPSHHVSQGLSEALAWYVSSDRLATRHNVRDNGALGHSLLEVVG
jgi:UDP-N-acetylglucosamine 4-epimerase